MLDTLSSLNQQSYEEFGDPETLTRIAQYEMAFRMQSAVPDAMNLSDEPEHIHSKYGTEPGKQSFANNCLLARRLVERGVRLIELYDSDWDHHGGIINALPATCRKVDRPSAGLVADLKRRGLLDETLVHWGGEMGRLPVVQNEKNIGRDHNTYGFSMWLAGGGIRGGHVHGETDELGHRAVVDPVSHVDYHATLMQLFGIEHDALTFRRPNGLASLTDAQECRVVEEILA